MVLEKAEAEAKAENLIICYWKLVIGNFKEG